MIIILATILAVVWLAGFGFVWSLCDMSSASFARKLLWGVVTFLGWPVFAASAAYSLWRWRP